MPLLNDVVKSKFQNKAPPPSSSEVAEMNNYITIEIDPSTVGNHLVW